ncbi:MAG: ATP-binding protein [Lachnospiraceae bacterium]|nr:ATP-binding protein [Lachnospiraceae bacterium]
MGLFDTKKSNKEKYMKETILKSLLDNVVDGVIAADENAEILYANAFADEILKSGKLGSIDIISKNPKTFYYNDIEYSVRYSDLPEDNGRRGTMVFIYDILKEKKKDIEIDELKDKLDDANKFKTNLLANMSHEIRTPIHAIIGFSEMVAKQDISEDVKGQIDMIKESSYSLLAIINDVLDLSKLESKKVELVYSNYYISYIIRDIEATFSLLAMRKGLKFEMHLDNNIPSYMYGDKIRIRGALLNILNNAIKFTKEGTVSFSIHVLEKARGVVTLQFVIKDTGIGIKEEDQGRIFDSFSKFSIDNNYGIEGRGLGLAIAKGYMDLMGGVIDVKSKIGEGSEFTVTLTQKIIDDSPVDMKIVNARKQKNTEKFLIHDYKVLVVDDNSINLTVAEGLLKTYGLKADKVQGGREAIDICKDKEYDLIFMDQMMPGVDGIEAMKSIKQLNDFYANTCKYIVLTADAMAGVRDRLLKEGFDEYLCKPLEIHRLEETLKRFVPEEYIYKTIDEIPNNIVLEESKASVIPEDKKPDEVELLAAALDINLDVLNKKIRDCGGTLSDYKEICVIAYNHSEAKINKLNESKTIKDYDRYTIEVHSLKSSLATLGAMDLSQKARILENAGKSGNYELIDAEGDNLVAEYSDFMAKIRKAIIEDLTGEQAEAEEWSREEISKVVKKMSGMVDDFNFGGIFELIEQIKGMEMGPETRATFDSIAETMDNMDIDSLKKQLGDLV